MHFAEKNLFAERIDKYLRENHPPETTGGDERNKFETRLKTVKLRWMDDICISVSVLKNLISAFGVSLTELELEDLVMRFSLFTVGFVNYSWNKTVCYAGHFF